MSHHSRPSDSYATSLIETRKNQIRNIFEEFRPFLDYDECRASISRQSSSNNYLPNEFVLNCRVPFRVYYGNSTPPNRLTSETFSATDSKYCALSWEVELSHTRDKTFAIRLNILHTPKDANMKYDFRITLLSRDSAELKVVKEFSGAFFVGTASPSYQVILEAVDLHPSLLLRSSACTAVFIIDILAIFPNPKRPRMPGAIPVTTIYSLPLRFLENFKMLGADLISAGSEKRRWDTAYQDPVSSTTSYNKSPEPMARPSSSNECPQNWPSTSRKSETPTTSSSSLARSHDAERRVEKSEQGTPESFKDFEKIYSNSQNKRFTDFVIKSHDGDIHAIKAILVARSTYFANFLKPSKRSDERRTIKLEADIDPGADLMREVWFCMLTSHISESRSDSEKTARRLLTAARDFGVSVLMSECQQLLQIKLNKSNAEEYYHLANEYGLEDLKNEAEKFLQAGLHGYSKRPAK